MSIENPETPLIDFTSRFKSLPETSQLAIKYLQAKRRVYNKRLRRVVESTGSDQNRKILISAYRKYLVSIEFDLQILWQFPPDSNMHKFWYNGGCICPKKENDAKYGTLALPIINIDCPVHGEKQKRYEDSHLKEIKACLKDLLNG